jgi:hypothetical protein
VAASSNRKLKPVSPGAFQALTKFLCLLMQFPALGLQLVDNILIVVNLGACKSIV